MPVLVLVVALLMLIAFVSSVVGAFMIFKDNKFFKGLSLLLVGVTSASLASAIVTLVATHLK